MRNGREVNHAADPLVFRQILSFVRVDACEVKYDSVLSQEIDWEQLLTWNN